MLLATAAIPFVLPPVTIDGQSYVDGGVADNEPIAVAVASGAQRVVVVGCGPATKLVHDQYPGVAILHLLQTDAVVGLLDMLDFRPENIERLFRLGQEDTTRQLGLVAALAAASDPRPLAAAMKDVRRASSAIDQTEAALAEGRRLLHGSDVPAQGKIESHGSRE